jgi:hypothetical protein
MGTVHAWNNTHQMLALTVAPEDKPQLITCPECRVELDREQQDPERYVLEVFRTEVIVSDDQSGERWAFSGPDRLLNATEKLNQLKLEVESKTPAFHRLREEAKKLHLIEPSAFLADLTGYARRQRLTAMLKQVREIETQAVALLADDARRLSDATALRERLEKMLERTVSPLSGPQSDQKPAAQGEDTPASAPREAHARREASIHADEPRLLFKPQPY